MGGMSGGLMGGFIGLVGGLVASLVVLFLIALAWGKLSTTDKRALSTDQPPLVSASVDALASKGHTLDLSDRLRQLDVAKAAGLVSDFEYKTAREKILCQ